MKSAEQIRAMQSDLVEAGLGLRMSGAPAKDIDRTMIALAAADDALNWVIGDTSRLAELEIEHRKMRDEQRQPEPDAGCEPFTGAE